MNREILLVALVVLVFTPLTAEPTLTLESSGWNATASTRLEAGVPGGDVRTDRYSDTAQQTMAISGTDGDDESWCVQVRRTDFTWDDDLVLYARVTAQGDGAGELTGASDFLAVTPLYQEFFCGSGARSGIEIQLKLSGVSVSTVERGVHSTSVVYTIVRN